MKSMLRAIAKAMRAMSRAVAGIVRKTIEIGGKLVSVLVPGPMPAIDEIEPAEEGAANDNIPAPISENAGIRDLAYSQITCSRPTAQQLGSVTVLQADWLATMDSEMARRVLKASDAEINAHLRGIRPIKGVLWCDEEVIDDYQTARIIDNARMERALGLDQPLQPKMPG